MGSPATTTGKSGERVEAVLDDWISVHVKLGLLPTPLDSTFKTAQLTYDAAVMDVGLDIGDIYDRWIYVFHYDTDGTYYLYREIRATHPADWTVWDEPDPEKTIQERHAETSSQTDGIVELRTDHFRSPLGYVFLVTPFPLSRKAFTMLDTADFKRYAFGETARFDLDHTYTVLAGDPYLIAREIHAKLFLPGLGDYHAYHGNADRQAKVMVARAVDSWLKPPGKAKQDPFDLESRISKTTLDTFLDDYKTSSSALATEVDSRWSWVEAQLKSSLHAALDTAAMDAILGVEGDAANVTEALYHWALVSRGMNQCPKGQAAQRAMLQAKEGLPGGLFFNDDLDAKTSTIRDFVLLQGGRKGWTAATDLYTDWISSKISLLEARAEGLGDVEKFYTEKAQKELAEATTEAEKEKKRSEKAEERASRKESNAATYERQAGSFEARADSLERSAAADREAAKDANQRAADHRKRAGGSYNADRVQAYLARIGVSTKYGKYEARVSKELTKSKDGTVPRKLGGSSKKKLARTYRRLVRESRQAELEKAIALENQAAVLESRAEGRESSAAGKRRVAADRRKSAHESKQKAEEYRKPGDNAEQAARSKAQESSTAAQQYQRERNKLSTAASNAAATKDLGVLVVKAPIQALLNVINLQLAIQDARRGNAANLGGITFGVAGAAADLLEITATATSSLVRKDKLLGRLSAKSIPVFAIVSAVMDIADAGEKASKATATGQYDVMALYAVSALGAGGVLAGAGMGIAGSSFAGPVAVVGMILWFSGALLAEWVRDNDYQIFAEHCFVGKESHEAVQPDWATVSFGGTHGIQNEATALQELLGRFRHEFLLRVWHKEYTHRYTAEKTQFVFRICPGTLLSPDTVFHVEIDIRRSRSSLEVMTIGKALPILSESISLAYSDDQIKRAQQGHRVWLEKVWTASDVHMRDSQWEATLKIELQSAGKQLGKTVTSTHYAGGKGHFTKQYENVEDRY